MDDSARSASTKTGSPALVHARSVIGGWRGEYREERPKDVLGGRTPVQYAKQLAEKAVTLTAGLQMPLLLKAGGVERA